MSPIMTALFITVIGMGLVFIAILLLWGLMEVIVKATAKPIGEEVESEAEANLEPAPASDLKLRAVAAAVAIAIALRRVTSPAGVSDIGAQGNVPSAWQTISRAARLSQRDQIFTRK